MKRYITPNLLFVLVGGLLAGALLLVAIRFVTLKPPEAVHYHANFALYVNGERDEFKGPGYYEEVSACSAEHQDNPKSRTHMHDNVNHIVHVHDNAVTWGQFFANFGYTLGDKVLKTNDGVFVDSKGGKLNFILNGKETDFIANRVIGDEDVLLISFGQNKPTQLKALYGTVETDAGEYNAAQDPAACAGDEEFTFSDRLKQAIGIGGSATH